MIGGQFESADSSTAYFAGYLLYKLDQFHLKKKRIKIKDCTECSNTLVTQDSHHMFLIFKEYKDEVTF